MGGCQRVLIGGLPAARVDDDTLCLGVGATDAITQGEGSVLIGGKAAARLDDPTSHGGSIVAGCPTVLIGRRVGEGKRDKAERWKCRKELIAQAREKAESLPPGAERDKLTDAIDRFERDNTAVEKARLCADGYDPSKGPPEGWKNISNDPDKLAGYGLTPDDLEKAGSDFRTQVYEPDPDVFGQDLRPTVVFKGTSPTSLEDWTNNFKQGLNLDAPYYENAVNIGNKLLDSGASVDIAGHSLGGGLASAASRATGLPATTFNAAGLNPNTVPRYGGTPIISNPDVISAFRVGGEILTGLQEQGLAGTIFAGLAGQLLGGPQGAAVASLLKMGLSAALPDSIGTVFELPGHALNPISRHGMDQVIDGLEEQKREDQYVLSGTTGKQCG